MGETCFGFPRLGFIVVCILAGVGVIIGVIGGIIYGINVAKLDYLQSECTVDNYYIEPATCSEQRCTGSGDNRDCTTYYYPCYRYSWDVDYAIVVDAPPAPPMTPHAPVTPSGPGAAPIPLAVPPSGPASAPAPVATAPTDAPSPLSVPPPPPAFPTPAVAPSVQYPARPPVTTKLIISNIIGGTRDYYYSADNAAQSHPIGSSNSCWYDPNQPYTVQWDKPDPGPGLITMIVGFAIAAACLMLIGGIILYAKIRNR